MMTSLKQEHRETHESVRQTGSLGRSATLVSFAALGALLCACNGEGPVDSEPGPTLDEQLSEALAGQKVTSVTPPPAQDPKRVALGQLLFFEKEISGRRNISCGTCHSPLLGSADGQSQSRGQGATGLGPQRRHGDKSKFLARNTLSVWNRGVPGWDTMFWDGRLDGNKDDGYVSPAGDPTPQEFSSALAAFSIIPVTPDEEMRGFPGELDVNGNPNEMGELTNDDFAKIWPLVVARVMGVEAYRKKMLEAFPGTKEADITILHVGEAIGAFMSEAFTALDTPFDRYLAGDTSALSDAEKRGALLFYGRASCSSCHSGALQTDFGFHNIAAPQVGTGKGDEAPLDFGRGRITMKEADRFQFRTPSLRNVELEGPWMHNGAYSTLEATVRHHLDPSAALKAYKDNQVEPELLGKYQKDANEQMLAKIDPKLAPTGDALKDADVADLMAFLSALTDPKSLNLLHLIPDEVPSGLPTRD